MGRFVITCDYGMRRSIYRILQTTSGQCVTNAIKQSKLNKSVKHVKAEGVYSKARFVTH
jgi:hypothetical protein